LQTIILFIPIKTVQTRALACCGFHHRNVDNFIVKDALQESTRLYPLDCAGDRRMQGTNKESPESWHDDCL